jgi:aspartate racemase
MKHKQKTKIGIIGGIGPQASAELYRHIIHHAAKKYDAKLNHHYPELVIHSLPLTNFINDSKHADIGKTRLLQALSDLEEIGCNHICIACNTVHLFETDFKNLLGNKFISLTRLVKQELANKKFIRPGFVATPTTVNHKLYGEQIYIDSSIQPQILDIINQALGGEITNATHQKFINIMTHFINQNNLDAVVLGCTELSLLSPGIHVKVPLISSLHLLADHLLDIIYSNNKDVI